ncbi:MAG: protoheme IX farnesyltransferase [Pseudomonadota bacterium]
MADQDATPEQATDQQPKLMASDFAEAREGVPTGEHHTPSAAELKARGRRNIAIALAVAGFVMLVYLTTFFRLAENLQAASGAS